ncbi:LAME_0A05908g1_1 [Lachancea meyersii CBS 8951]|uniref:LAME_0A05908g1_1 n=1 Tax=Lachancea meyersii CBS 8951 TaxID=1266667 RepID=A0A1G4IQN3_9SACH|nr:LAME_0A05908g1_1 [Lachancea meyersii CBS 8951]
MGYLSKNSMKGLEVSVPPDLDSPPFYIPVKSIRGRYTLMQELGNGSFGSVTLAKKIYKAPCPGCKNCNHYDDKIETGTPMLQQESQQLQCEPCDSRPHYRNTLMEDSAIFNVEQENYYNKQRGVLAIKTMMTRLPTLNDYTRVREIKFILSMPAHKNLVQIFELFIDDINYQLHIVMECMEQNLYQLMRARRRRVFSLPSLKSILSQLLAGVQHIHAHNFFHRDLKPENILISPANHYFNKNWIMEGHYSDNYVVKIADYGLARHVTNKSPYTAYVSTRWYRSPEILLRKGSYSRPLDIWAFGCVVVEVATFRPLFPGSDEMDQIWKILEVLGTPHTMSESSISGYQPHGGSWEKAQLLASRMRLKFPYVEGINIEKIIDNPNLQPLCDVVKACLTWDPKKRATVTELCQMSYFQNTEVGNYARVPKALNDENINRIVPVGHQSNWGSKLPIKKAFSGNQNLQIPSLGPNVIDMNGGRFGNSKEGQMSFQQFLQESAVSDPLTDSTVSSSVGEEEKPDSQDELLGNMISLPLSQQLDNDLPLSTSAPDIINVDQIKPLEVCESFNEYYITKSTEYGEFNTVDSLGDLEPNYVHYEEGNNVHPQPRCNVLDDMSIDSNASGQIPRSFAVPQITEDCGDTSLEDHNSHSFSHTNSLTF